ncbi:hypothetical protein GO013_04170 [Pseudodesulfovibrio sp. JC047]|uniref:hypothetical protein n=1 Tax=Pseudodesulfovibrio sp. JC047 TaxID=2683199 RepID=UPI0013D171A3|nr:hypothetical protein [Pseudodesulfovibrio sp. JC047]NDV18614.1 hypothetical protein [Pseudodesulfovibrio sp. JC047]
MRVIARLVPLMLVVFIIGCAAKGPVHEARDDNRVVYTSARTGQTVIVEIGSAYTYDSFIKRDFKGTDFHGFLYRADDESVILVSKMPRAEFEDLIGFTLDAPASSTRQYPPKTIFQSAYCKLVRTYVTTLDTDVVSAVKLQTPTTDESLCEDWTSLDEVMAERFDMLADFDASADENIHMILQ